MSKSADESTRDRNAAMHLQLDAILARIAARSLRKRARDHRRSGLRFERRKPDELGSAGLRHPASQAREDLSAARAADAADRDSRPPRSRRHRENCVVLLHAVRVSRTAFLLANQGAEEKQRRGL